MASRGFLGALYPGSCIKLLALVLNKGGSWRQNEDWTKAKIIIQCSIGSRIRF